MPKFFQYVLKFILVGFYSFILLNYLRARDFSWFFDSFNLLIHEGGHMVFGFFGELLGVMGGTIMQLLVPLLTVLVFLRQRDYFAISFSIFWFGTNLFHVARYMSDALDLSLSLISLGSGEPIHDWNYILSHFNLLSKTYMISDFVYGCGYFFIFGAIIFGVGVLLYEIKHRRSSQF